MTRNQPAPMLVAYLKQGRNPNDPNNFRNAFLVAAAVHRPTTQKKLSKLTVRHARTLVDKTTIGKIYGDLLSHATKDLKPDDYIFQSRKKGHTLTPASIWRITKKMTGQTFKFFKHLRKLDPENKSSDDNKQVVSVTPQNIPQQVVPESREVVSSLSEYQQRKLAQLLPVEVEPDLEDDLHQQKKKFIRDTIKECKMYGYIIPSEDELEDAFYESLNN